MWGVVDEGRQGVRGGEGGWIKGVIECAYILPASAISARVIRTVFNMMVV